MLQNHPEPKAVDHLAGEAAVVILLQETLLR
jgi:hypothetical protein